MTSASTSSRYSWFVLVLVVATSLRLIHISRDSLWLDEAISVLTAQLPLSDILNNTIQDPHPPLYYLVLALWRFITPDNDGWFRGLSVVFDLLLIPALYTLTTVLGRSRREAQVVAWLVALSPFQILYSHEARMYTLLMLMMTLTVLVYVWARPQTNLWPWVLFTVCGAAALYIHLFTAMTLLAIGLYALLCHQERPALWRTMGAGVIIGLLFLPWVSVMLAESPADGGAIRPLVQDTFFNPILPLTTPAFLLFGLSSHLIYSGVSLFLTLALGVIGLMDGRKAWHEGTGQGLLLPALVVGLTLFVPLTVYFVRPFFLPERTMAAAAPFLLLFLAWGTTRRASPLPYLAWGAAALMVIGTTVYLFGGAQKPPYREVMALVAEAYQPGDIVVHTSDGSYLPALHYVDWSEQVLLAGDPDPRKAVAVYEAWGGQVWTTDEVAAASPGRFWLIVALEHSEEWQMEQVEIWQNRFHLLETQSIGGIVIYLFD